MNCEKKQNNQIKELKRRRERARKYNITARLYENQVNSIKNALNNADNEDNVLVLLRPKKRVYKLNKMSSNQLNKLRTRMYCDKQYSQFCRDKVKKNLSY